MKRVKDDGQAKVKLVFVELEGSDETIQNAINTITRTLSSSGTTHRSLPHVLQSPAGEVVDGDIFAEEVDLDQEAGSSTVSTKKRVGTTTRRKPRTMEILDIDLLNHEKPFREYYNAVNPKAVSKRYIMISYWLKEYPKISQINSDHIYTCLKAVNLTPPKDPTQPFRDLCQNGWMKSVGNGMFEITHVGEGEAMKLASGVE